jgi:hypothetical protein
MRLRDAVSMCYAEQMECRLSEALPMAAVRAV